MPIVCEIHDVGMQSDPERVAEFLLDSLEQVILLKLLLVVIQKIKWRRMPLLKQVILLSVPELEVLAHVDDPRRCG